MCFNGMVLVVSLVAHGVALVLLVRHMERAQ